MSLRDKLKGTGVAIVTPFKNQEIDYASLGNLIENLIENNVEYIVTMGTTGESPTLTAKEKIELADFTLKKINKRVPCVIGVATNNTNAVLASMDTFDLSAFDALLSTSPYYNKPSQEGIYRHYKAIAEHSPIPVLIYNVPSRTGSNVLPETVLRLANDCEMIGGIKEATGNLVQAMHILRKRPDNFLVVSGDDHVAMPLIASGGDGVISVIANCFPKDFAELIRAALANNFATAQQLQYQLLPAIDLLFAENNPAGVKCFLAEQGIIANELRLPNVPISEKFRKEIQQFINEY